MRILHSNKEQVTAAFRRSAETDASFLERFISKGADAPSLVSLQESLRAGIASALEKAHDPNQPRIPKGQQDAGRWVKRDYYVSSIAKLYEMALTSETDNRKAVEFGRVDEAEALRLSESTGLAIRAGMIHMMDIAAVRHIIDTHGGQSEEMRGQVPITIADMEQIPDVIANPDKVTYEGKTYRGLPLIQYTKRVNGHYICVEEVRNRRMRLAVKTFYKFKKADSRTEKAAGGAMLFSQRSRCANVLTRPEAYVIIKHPLALVKSAEPPVAHRIRVHGLLISVENPRGTIRTKKGGDGKEWSRRMSADYGRIVGSRGTDGDQIDVFVGKDHAAPNAYIVNQLKADGSFDEFKIVVGVSSKDEAKALYLKHYPKGWKVGHVEEKPWSKFLAWLDDGQRSGEACPNCGAVHEHSERGCNRCGKTWPVDKPQSGHNRKPSMVRYRISVPSRSSGSSARAGGVGIANLDRTLMPANPLLKSAPVDKLVCPSCHKRTRTAPDGKCEHCGHWNVMIESGI